MLEMENEEYVHKGKEEDTNTNSVEEEEEEEKLKSCKSKIESNECIKELEHNENYQSLKLANNLHLFQSQQVEEIEDKMKKETMDLKKKVNTMHEEATIKWYQIEVLQEEATYFECKNKLMESEITNKTAEISSLKQDSKCEKTKEKT